MNSFLCAAMMVSFLAMALAIQPQAKAADQADPAPVAPAAEAAMRSPQPEEANSTGQDQRVNIYNDVAANGRFYKNSFQGKSGGSGGFGGLNGFGGYGGSSGGYGSYSGYGRFGGSSSYDDDDDDSSYRPKYRPQYQSQSYQQYQPPKQPSNQLGIHPCQLVSALGMIRNRAMAPLRPKNDRRETRKPCTTYDLERVVDMLNVLMVTVAKSSHCGLQALNLIGGSMDPFGYGQISSQASYRQGYDKK